MPTPGRRQLDGPVRRVPSNGPETPANRPLGAADQQVAASGSIDKQDTLEIPSIKVVSDDSPVPDSTRPVTEPVYEYHKPRNRRFGRKWFVIVPLVALLTVGGWFGFKAYQAAGRIITSAGSGAPALAGVIDPTKLKGEGDGRVNILVLGVGGAGHEGPNLSDTMMIWSLDPKTKDVAMLSVPRDLYVKIPSGARNQSQYGKINSANAIGGPATAEQVVSGVLGVPIHYYVVMDFAGFKQAIDAVGGIDIDVKEALFDRTYPCETGNKYCPYSQAAGKVHMNGLQALRYSRCRHNEPGIGNCGNDYGRAERQQQVITALRQKALSLGTLTNPLKLTSLIDAVGDHLKTDIQLGELKKLARLAKDIDPSKIVNKVLDDSPESFLTGGVNIIPQAGYIYVPRLGTFDYSDIQDFVKNIFVDHYITGENAAIEIQNGTGVAGLAGKVASSLTAAHYNVLPPLNASGNVASTVIYDYTFGKKPYTINYLEKRFGVKALKVSPPSPTATPIPAASSTKAAPQATTTTPEIRIILGTDYQPTIAPTLQPNASFSR